MKKTTFTLLIMLLVSTHVSAKRVHLFHMGRNFTMVVPAKPSRTARPLIVLLHGCKQNSNLILQGTKLEEEAIKNNFIVLAPEQPNYYNIDHCWNWFLNFQQQRNFSNEMGQIISAIDLAVEDYKADPARIFVTGISAGGVMAHNLTACYPDVFSASAIHSGLTFKVAETISEAQTVLTSYEQKTPEYLGKKIYECGREARKKRLKKVLIIHGKEDSRVPSFHSDLISLSQEVWRDYADDGRRNDSVKPKTRKSNLRFSSGYSVEKTDKVYPGFLETKIMVNGLGHAWGGGRPVSVNFDPKAPSSNKFILEFFGLK